MSYEQKIILKHSLASIVALALFGLSRFLYSVVISRKFGLETLGSVNSLISQAFLLAIPLSFFAIALGKYTSEFLGRGEFERIKSISTISFSFPVLGLLLLPFNVYISILATLRAFQLTFRSFVYGLHRGEAYAYAIIFSFIIFLASFAFEDPYLPYIAMLFSIVLFSKVYIFKERFFGVPRFEDLRLLINYSAFAFLGTLAGVFLVQGPYFLSEKFGSSLIAGKVSASLSAAFLLTYLPQVLQSAIMPLYSYKYGKNEMDYVTSLAENTTRVLSLVIAFCVFALFLFGREILSLLFDFSLGSEFYLAVIAVEIYIAYNPSIIALNSTKYVKKGTVISVIGAMISLFFLSFLVPKFGEQGAMLGLIFGYSAIFIGVIYFAKRYLGVSMASYKPLLYALPLQMLIFVSKSVLSLGLLVYIFFMRKEIGEMMEMFKSFRSRGF
jgi:O-antigen/teichoic acid export membrane protein